MTEAVEASAAEEFKAPQVGERELLAARLQRLMFVRIFIVTALFALSMLLEAEGNPSAQPATNLYPIIIAAYAFSGIYAFAAKRTKSLELFTYLQFAVDALCIGLVVLFTGAEESAFILLFVFNVLGAGYLLLVPGGLIVASLDAFVYALCLVLAWNGVAPQMDSAGFVRPPPWQAGSAEALSTYFTVGFHFLGFHLLGMLAGSLSRKQTETGQALARASDSLLRLRDMHGRIVQNIDVGLVTIDGDSRITSFNRAAEEITRHEGGDVLGQEIGAVMPGVERRVRKVLDGTSLPVHGHTFERWATRKDGKRVFLRTSLSAMRAMSGEVEGYILVFEDRTRLLLMEERLQREERLAAVGRLSAAIAHEIRNPLSSITGSVQVLRAGAGLQEEDAELLGLVQREAARLNDLVTDFLALARDEVPKLQPGQLGLLLRETVALLERRVEGQLKVDLELEYDPEILLDGARMRQVFWNLFNNASLAMPAGGTIRVKSERITPEHLGLIATGQGDSGYWEFNEVGAAATEEGIFDHGVDAIRLTVTDQGEGIPDESLASIFDPFYTTRSGGTGLGLAIVQRIVQSHGGVISVRSKVGQGTTFAIWLPVRSATDLTTESMGSIRPPPQVLRGFR
ncbi:MAG: PAS domain S-box protein [Deltaproteobacteria bacterium]|nr:PAS domain S-box protein [Deltaproteobacteria bacterium]